MYWSLFVDVLWVFKQCVTLLYSLRRFVKTTAVAFMYIMSVRVEIMVIKKVHGHSMSIQPGLQG